MNIYEIKQEMMALKELLEKDSFDVDQETGEVFDNSETLKELANEIELKLEEKADAIIYIHKEFEEAEKALKDEVKRLNERKTMMIRKQKQLKDLLDYILAGQKLKTTKFTIFYGKSESLEIVDESKVPQEFIAFTPKIDKTNLKKAVKNKEIEVDGIELKTNISLRWR